MNSIKVRPNTFSLLAVCSFTLLAILFTFFYPVSFRDPDSIYINYKGLFFMVIPLAFLPQLKSVKIADGKIRIVYLLKRKKITAPMEMISSVTFAFTNSEPKKFYDKVVIIEFKDKKRTTVKISGAMHSNMQQLEEYIRSNFPNLTSYS